MNHTKVPAWKKSVRAGVVALVLAAMVPLMAHAAPEGVLLAGTVKSAAGAKMGGVTVSAKLDNTTITTSVFTDEDGAYYFPAMSSGHYNVWAQADGFEIARGSVDLTGTKHQDFVLNPGEGFRDAVVRRPDTGFAAGPDSR